MPRFLVSYEEFDSPDDLTIDVVVEAESRYAAYDVAREVVSRRFPELGLVAWDSEPVDD